LLIQKKTFFFKRLQYYAPIPLETHLREKIGNIKTMKEYILWKFQFFNQGCNLFRVSLKITCNIPSQKKNQTNKKNRLSLWATTSQSFIY